MIGLLAVRGRDNGESASAQLQVGDFGAGGGGKELPVPQIHNRRVYRGTLRHTLDRHVSQQARDVTTLTHTCRYDKHIDIGKKKTRRRVHLKIFDTAGQEEMAALWESHLKDKDTGIR